MKSKALQDYTKQKKLYEQNQQQILDRFIEYIAICSDPINIFKYMEEKSICIYLGNYWIYKAEIFADMGDYTNVVLCLKEAESRDHIVSEKDLHFQEKMQMLFKKLTMVMKRRPPKGKKSAFQYETLYEEQQKITLESLQKVTQIYTKHYKQAQNQAEKLYKLKIQGKQKSWLASIQDRKSEKMMKIEQKIRSVGNIEEFYSMRTPVRNRDPMKMTKTMDSIEMLKKKKSTKSKGKIQHTQSKQQQNEEQQQNQCSNSVMVNSTPVGLYNLKRRVTFKSADLRIEKIRSQQQDNVDQQQQNEGHNKKSDQEKSPEYSMALIKRSSILRNKGANIDGMDDDEYQ